MIDVYNRKWITKNAVEVLGEYSSGITLRQLHYRLVALGMTNDVNHYKRVIGAMTVSRWDRTVSMDSFIDRERAMYGKTECEEKLLEDEIATGKTQIEAWINSYGLNRWSNQENYIEVWIEKKALQGVFERPCLFADVGLAPCKGYPSITFLSEASHRFINARDNDKNLIILYFGDYDPSGEDIPHSIKRNFNKFGVDIDIKRIALNPDQIKKMRLPGVPPKSGDSRTKNWAGDAVVECDAVEPKTLSKMCKEAIEKYFDETLYDELKEKEEEEKELYKIALKKFIKNFGSKGEL